MNTTSESNSRGQGAFKYELLLLLVSMIWGSAFVAQQIGMEKGLGPMTFNGLRFALGCLSLIPVILWRKKNLAPAEGEAKLPYMGTLGAGLFLFAAAAFQQIGLQYTSSANSGFITAFYILFVPVLGMFFGHKVPKILSAAIPVCLIGFYLLSVTGDFVVSKGDWLTLISAVLWAGQILVIDHAVGKGAPSRSPAINTFGYVEGSPLAYVDVYGLAKKFPADHQHCKALRAKMDNLRKELDDRWSDYAKDVKNLPERIGPGEALGATRRGHRTLINDRDSKLRGYEKRYSDECEEECKEQCPGGAGNALSSMAAGAAATGSLYLMYRCVRMLPSFAPPLWWTIPANAATP